MKFFSPFNFQDFIFNKFEIKLNYLTYYHPYINLNGGKLNYYNFFKLLFNISLEIFVFNKN